MYVPDASNSSTCGAGTQHSACGGVAAAPRMSAVMPDGSWTIQTWSCRSMESPRTGPRKNVSGSDGQKGSTRSEGGVGRSCAVGDTAISATTSAATMVRSLVMAPDLTPDLRGGYDTGRLDPCG